MKQFYLDTCIWINLFKKEGDPEKGIPYWEIAKEFINNLKDNNNQIIVSTIILKELSFKAEDKFELIKSFFEKEEYIKIIRTTPEDYSCD